MLCHVKIYFIIYIMYYIQIFFELSKVASSIILPAKTEPIWTLSEPVITTLCLQMGGLRPPLPPPPPRFLFRLCRLVFKNITP